VSTAFINDAFLARIKANGLDLFAKTDNAAVTIYMHDAVEHCLNRIKHFQIVTRGKSHISHPSKIF
jgi:hypothetical protein